MKSWYYWHDMRKNIDWYIVNCHSYCWFEKSQDWFSELLKLLLISDQSWQHVSMNYESLCKNKNDYNTVFVVVNRLNKYSIFMLCIKETTVKNMTWMYINQVYQIYKFSDFIVSDQELQFIFAFWNEFCKILEIKLKLSTACHTQIDNQTKIVNQHIQQ